MTTLFDALILDTETTDADNPQVIELAYMNFGSVQIFGGRYKPTAPIAWGAMGVHHILPSDLEGCRPHTEAPDDVPAARYWIGHNIDFDWKALGSPEVKRICTLALCRSLWPETKSHTLSAMAYFCLGANEHTRELVRSAHGAAADVKLCFLILETICKVVKTTNFDDLWELSEEARVPKRWTFGKFKDQPISAADRGYANWYRRQPDPDPYVLTALRRAGLL